MRTFLIALVSLLLSGAAYAQNTFNRVACGSAVTIHIKQGDSCTYTYTESSKNEASGKLIFEIYNNTLHIEGDAREAEAFITLKELRGLSISGVTKVKMDEVFRTTDVRLEFNGASRGIIALDAQKLDLETSGAAQVSLSGDYGTAQIVSSGASKVLTQNSRFNTCDVQTSGAAICVIDSVRENLKATATGASKIYIKSVPEVYLSSRNGLGKIYEGNEFDSVAASVTDMHVVIKNEDDDKATSSNDNDTHHGRPNWMHNWGSGDAGFNWAGFDIGFNALLNKQNTIEAPAGHNYLDMNHAISLQYNLNLFEKDFKLYKRYVMGMVGAGFSWNNYRFNNSYVLQPNQPVLTAIQDTVRSFNVNKLRLSYFNVPVMLGFNTSVREKRAFHVAAGVVIGLRLNGMVKTTSDNTESYRKKTFGLYNTDAVKYDAMIRLKYKWANVWVSYSLNELFRKNQGPQVHPIAVGVSVISF